MPTRIEKNADKILLAIAQEQENNNSQEYLTALQIQNLTNLNSIEINNAIQQLNDLGYIELISGLGQHPFVFELVKITYLGVQKAEQNNESNRNSKNFINGFCDFVTMNKYFLSITIIIGFIAAIFSLIPSIVPSENIIQSENILQTIEIKNTDKIIFKGMGENIWTYHNNFDFEVNVWVDNPNILNISFVSFSKINNTVQKEYMVDEREYSLSNYTDYEIYVENPSNINIEPTDRQKQIPIRIHLRHFMIDGKYYNPLYQPKLNFYLGNITFLVNLKDIKKRTEKNNTITIPVYWMNNVLRD